MCIAGVVSSFLGFQNCSVGVRQQMSYSLIWRHFYLCATKKLLRTSSIIIIICAACSSCCCVASTCFSDGVCVCRACYREMCIEASSTCLSIENDCTRQAFEQNKIYD